MIYIGIDPDLKLNGVAFWDKPEKELTIRLISTPTLIILFNSFCLTEFQVIIEAGWLNKKSNFRTKQNKATGEAIARNVGENHAAGKIIQQACEELGINYKLVRPRTAKVSKDYFFKLTGVKAKTQEEVDAGILVYGL